MARTVRSRTLDASPEQVWRVVANPHHLPRWWPGVIRVENVRDGNFTEVIPTKRGKPVRLDHTITESVEFQLRRWEQEPAGTPFERLLESWTTTVELTPEGERTTVTITEHQRLRGSFKLGTLLQLRPARKRVTQALANLSEIVG